MGHVISANPITCPITLQSDGLGSGSSMFGVMKYMIDAYYVVQHVM